MPLRQTELLQCTLRRPAMGEVLSTRIWGVPRPAWAVCSYSSSSPAGGTPQILVDKTSPMTGRLRVYMPLPLPVPGDIHTSRNQSEKST